jgi:hypothetical protein
MKLPEKLRFSKFDIQVVLIVLAVATLLWVLSHASFVRGEVDRADGQAHYRSMVAMMEAGNWKPLCALTSRGFEGRLQVWQESHQYKSRFGRDWYCRTPGYPGVLVPDPDDVQLIEIRETAHRDLMTVEYVARWNHESEYRRSRTEITYIDQIERRFGDIRLHRRWIFETSKTL